MPVTVAPYGTWASPVRPELIGRTGNRVRSPENVEPAEHGICWTEQAPSDGRTSLFYRGPDGSVSELTPAPLSCESRVQEHGGRCYTVAGGVTFFANGADQRLYRRDPDASTRALTPELDVRYSEPVADTRRGLVYCVMEDHRTDGEPETSLVAVPMAGGSPVTLTSGHDFYGSARLSPDGSRLAWVSWDHPSMPWDATSLWVGELGEDGSLADCRQVAGGEQESALFPRWSPRGALHFLSDRSGYTNLYRLDDEGPTALGPEGVDCGEGLPLPLFNGGYDFLPDGRIFLMLVKDGTDSLNLLGPGPGMKEIPTPFTYIPEVRAAGNRALLVAAGPEQLRTVALVSPDGETQIIRPSPPGTGLGPGFTSRPETLSFPSDGTIAHGFLYPPANPGFQGPPGELPPLIVQAHGGPIGCTHPVRSLDIQMFTSRGFAVLDVNYRGSRGYGRAYREALYGRWGEADVDDCIAGARYVTDKGLADPARLMIRGGSAGGYTVLASLAFRDFYAGGISRFGLSNLERFMQPGGTHKFESRANIHLIGPYPEAAELYRARSPVYHAEQITVPVLLLQGSADPVVPAEQARGMAERLQALGRPVTVIEFEGEGHGFRRTENLVRAYHAELEFIASLFDLEVKE